MLDLGGRREQVPVECLEFRSVPATTAAARRSEAPLSRMRHRTVVALLSLVPIGAAVAVAANRLGWHRHS